jgi:CRISPR-associated protein Cas2
MYIIWVYDINTEDKKGQRRLRRIFKLSKQYLFHIQCSVFEGEITKAKLEKLKYEAKKIIDDKLDSLIIFKSREQKWLDKEIIGIEKGDTDSFI